MWRITSFFMGNRGPEHDRKLLTFLTQKNERNKKNEKEQADRYIRYHFCSLLPRRLRCGRLALAVQPPWNIRPIVAGNFLRHGRMLPYIWNHVYHRKYMRLPLRGKKAWQTPRLLFYLFTKTTSLMNTNLSNLVNYVFG